MNIQQCKRLIKSWAQSPDGLGSLLILGPPGVGKTDGVGQVTEEEGIDLVTLALPTLESVDLRGLPYRDDQNRTRWACPLPKSGRGILLLDEMTSAAADVQIAAHHLLWRERGSDMSLPEGWLVVATGNRGVADQTRTNPLTGPVRGRVTMIEVEADLPSWQLWARDHAISPFVQGFVQWRPELFATDPVPIHGAYPSPRGWARVNAIMQLALPVEIEGEALSGTVGAGAAAELIAYLKLARSLPSCEEIMDKPLKAVVPKEASLCYAITMALTQWSRVTGKTAMTYLQRLGAEYGVLWVKEVRDVLDVRKDPVSRAWVERHADILR